MSEIPDLLDALMRSVEAARVDRLRKAGFACTTEGCPGDGRYAAPGRGHKRGCAHPFPTPTAPGTAPGERGESA